MVGLNKKQDEGALDNLSEPSLAIIIKIQRLKTLLPRKTIKREFYSYCSITSWNHPRQYFPKLKILMARTRSARTEDLDRSQEPQGWTYASPLGTGDRVRVVFDGRDDSAQGLLNEPSVRLSLLVETTLTSSKVFLLLIILQVVRMITTTSKDGFCDVWT